MNELPGPGQQPADNLPPWSPMPSPAYPDDLPSTVLPPVQVRLVWNGWPGPIEGVRVCNVNTRTPSISVRLTGSVATDVCQAFAEFLADSIVDAVRPVPSTGMAPPDSSAELLAVAEELRDPRILAGKLVGAAVQVAAVHAGIPLPVARVMGKAAQDLLISLLSPDPDANKVEAVQYVDLLLSAGNGSLINRPALREVVVGETADVIDKLLDPDGRQLPQGPAPAPPSPKHTRAVGDLRPAAPASNPPAPRQDHTDAARPASPGWYWWDGAQWTDHGPSPSPGRPSPSPGPDPGREGPRPIP
jgi:hypothetical protein